MDPICCLLAICCPPESAEQRAALASFLVRQGVDANAAESAANAVLDHFALAPKAFGQMVAELAKAAKAAKDKP